MRAELIGVSKAVKDSDVAGLSDPDQDKFIAEVLKACADDLRRMVMDTPPLTEFAAQVTGPHNDPIQGMIHVHTVAAKFDLDRLPVDSDAYRVHVLQAEGASDGNARPEGLTL